MRIALLLLLALTLAWSWWMVMAPLPEELDPIDVESSGQQIDEDLNLDTSKVGDPEISGASFQRGDLADLPVEQRSGFIPVQVWGTSSPLPATTVTVLPFSKLGEVMAEIDLWPFIISTKVVLEYGEQVKADGNGVVYLAQTEGPSYVAARVGNNLAMVTALPAVWDGEALILRVIDRSTLDVRVRYADGSPVNNVPVTLICRDRANDLQLLGTERRLRTTADGFALFDLAESARRVLGEGSDVPTEISELASALGYTDSDFDTLLGSELAAWVSIYAGERITADLPQPFDFDSTIEMVLEKAGPLKVKVRRADGSVVDGKAKIEGYGSSRRRGKPYVFALPQGEARLPAVKTGEKYRLEIIMLGVDGVMDKVVDGPQASGEEVVSEFIVDDWPRIVAVVNGESGEVVSSKKLTLGFNAGRGLVELPATTDADGRFEVFVPSEFHNKKIKEFWVTFRHGKRGSMKVESAVITLNSVLSSFEDLGTISLK